MLDVMAEQTNFTHPDPTPQTNARDTLYSLESLQYLHLRLAGLPSYQAPRTTTHNHQPRYTLDLTLGNLRGLSFEVLILWLLDFPLVTWLSEDRSSILPSAFRHP